MAAWSGRGRALSSRTSAYTTPPIVTATPATPAQGGKGSWSLLLRSKWFRFRARWNSCAPDDSGRPRQPADSQRVPGCRPRWRNSTWLRAFPIGRRAAHHRLLCASLRTRAISATASSDSTLLDALVSASAGAVSSRRSLRDFGDRFARAACASIFDVGGTRTLKSPTELGIRRWRPLLSLQKNLEHVDHNLIEVRVVLGGVMLKRPPRFER
jgi:hypothetical protein